MPVPHPRLAGYITVPIVRTHVPPLSPVGWFGLATLHYTTRLTTQKLRAFKQLNSPTKKQLTPIHTGFPPRRAVVNFTLSHRLHDFCFPPRYAYLQCACRTALPNIMSRHKPEKKNVNSGGIIRKRVSSPPSGRKTVIRPALFWRPAARSIPAASASTRPNEASEKIPRRLGRRSP